MSTLRASSSPDFEIICSLSTNGGPTRHVKPLDLRSRRSGRTSRSLRAQSCYERPPRERPAELGSPGSLTGRRKAMLKRPLGRTGHESSVAILGGVAFSGASPDEVTGWLTRATQAGVNHLDIAPSYGEAETRVGPHLPAFRARLYISEKSMARDRDGARAELERSLELLQTCLLYTSPSPRD